MGYIGLVETGVTTVSTETMGSATYPLVISGGTATNVWTPANSLPPNNRGILILSRSHTVSVAGRKLTLHGGLPYVFNSRAALGAPVVEALVLALFVNGVCVRAISLALGQGGAIYASFAQIAATVPGEPGTHVIDLRAMVPTAGANFTVGGTFGSAGNPYLVVRESS